jgi:hypothetical protein
MSDGRLRKSGAKYKKLRKEHEEKEKRVIQKTRKLDSFFTNLKTGKTIYFIKYFF